MGLRQERDRRGYLISATQERGQGQPDMPSESLLPATPSTQEMADVERIIKIGGPNPERDFDCRTLVWLYDSDRCPAHMLEGVLWMYYVAPLFWTGNPESVSRELHRALYVEDCGLVPHLGGECALSLFAAVTKTAYHYSWRRDATTGDKLGVTIYIANPSAAITDYANAPGGQEYLRRAYEFLIADDIVVDNIIFEETFELNIDVQADVVMEGFTP